MRLLRTAIILSSIFFSFHPVQTLPASAQAGAVNALHVQALIDRYKQGIVKIAVEGSAPDGSHKEAAGSGFFAYSGSNISLIITAEHLIGSSETLQSKNPDWKVENGVVVRKITVSSLDEHGTLINRGSAVDVAPTPLPGVDIALLIIKQSGYASLPIAESIAQGLRDVMLLGFEAEKTELAAPPPIGFGQYFSPTELAVNVPSSAGESGGPWIDLQSGLVLAIDKGTKTGPAKASFLATPVALIFQPLKTYIPSGPPQITVSYKVCVGEYRERCPPDAMYRYCYFSVEDWAAQQCTANTITRLSTFGGNKCGLFN